MTEQQPPEVTPPPERPNRHTVPEPDVMPKWVPVLIGVVLVTLAALAVATGLRFRDNTLVRMVRTGRATRPPASAPAPPGEPEPGASLVYPGTGGGQVPGAHAAPPGNARAAISGGGTSGVEAITRTRTRRGMIVKIEPPDAVMFVNDVPMGQASQFDSEDEAYEFAAPGSYTVRFSAPGFRDRTFLVTSAEDAESDVAQLEGKLEKQ